MKNPKAMAQATEEKDRALEPVILSSARVQIRCSRAAVAQPERAEVGVPC